jgi:hypothetical protein
MVIAIPVMAVKKRKLTWITAPCIRMLSSIIAISAANAPRKKKSLKEYG